jgi:exonuclease SbcC
MRLLNLRIRGAIGLKPYGEEININFEQFDAGPLAIVGLNGAGKTTVLENLHPWPQLISRGGSMAKHFYLKDSLRELRFEYAGQEYFSKILIDGQKDKTEAYLYRGEEPLNDGKVTSYKETVNRLFGSPVVFFKSIFFSQNGTRISELTPGAKKEFFLGLLGLDKYERFTAYCKEQGATLYNDSAKIAGHRESLLQIAEANEQKLLKRPEIENQILTLSNEIKQSQKDHEHLKKEIESLKEKAAQQEQIEKRLDDIRSEKKSLEADILNLQTERDKKLTEIKTSSTNIDNEITELQNNLLEADAIREKADRLKELQTEFETLSAVKSDLQELELKKTNLRARVEAAKNSIKDEMAEIERKRADLKHRIEIEKQRFISASDTAEDALTLAEKAASQLDDVPCKDTPDFVATCPLITSAREAEASIEQLKIDVEKANADYKADLPEENELKTIQAQIEEKSKELEAPHELEPEIESISNQIRKNEFDADRFNLVREDIEVLKKTDWQELLNNLDKAEITIEERRKNKEDLKARQDQVTNDYSSRIAGIEVKRKTAVGKITELEKQIEDDLEPEINGKEMQIRLLQDKLDNQKSELASRKADLIVLGNLQDEYDKRQAELKTLSEAKAKIDSDISDWKLLERAFGKNGLQALELDAAGPEISNIATEVIQEFGRGWSVDIRTVRASADAKKDVETFEIIVSREEGIQSFDDLSGGEQVWVEEAIRKAVTIYLIKHAGRDYRTIMQDEADGALDPERAEAFLNTTIKAHELTGAHHTIIITQRESIWERIPQRIHLDPEKGEIKLVA